jgi:putative membrane protein (TIGR04086 family)
MKYIILGENMNYFKKIGKCLLYTFSTILIGILIITILNYLNLFGIKLVSISKIFVLVLAIFIGSFRLGIKSAKKGYLEGIKYGIIVSIILAILNLIIYHDFELKDLLLYLIIIICSCLGSMVGMTKHKDESLT